MTTTYLGSLSIGGVMPGANAIGIAGAAGINSALPNLASQLASLLAFTPQPVNFAAQISQLQTMITAIQLGVTLGLQPPSIASQLAAIAAMIAGLQAQISGLNAQLELIADFQGLLAAAGVHAYAFTGPVGNLSGELGARVDTTPGISGGDAGNALVLLTTTPATWAALSQIVQVTP